MDVPQKMLKTTNKKTEIRRGANIFSQLCICIFFLWTSPSSLLLWYNSYTLLGYKVSWSLLPWQPAWSQAKTKDVLGCLISHTMSEQALQRPNCFDANGSCTYGVCICLQLINIQGSTDFFFAHSDETSKNKGTRMKDITNPATKLYSWQSVSSRTWLLRQQNTTSIIAPMTVEFIWGSYDRLKHFISADII